MRSAALSAAILTMTLSSLSAQPLQQEIDRRAAAVTGKVVEWRRDLHRNPELSNRETRTAKIVADHLRALGLEVRTGVGGTGVVGLLRGAKAGPVVALRADMDALPVVEETALPFASTARETYNGAEVGRHARVRARRARGDAHGRRGSSRRNEGEPPRVGQVHLPARRGGGGGRGRDDPRRRAREPAAGSDLRAARALERSHREDRLPSRRADGGVRQVRDRRAWEADARRLPLARHRSDRRRLADRPRPADDPQPPARSPRSRRRSSPSGASTEGSATTSSRTRSASSGRSGPSTPT